MLEDTFSDIIQKARYGKGWSFSKLARESNLKERRLIGLERHDKPTRDEVAAIASALELDKKKLEVIAQAAWEPEVPSPYLPLNQNQSFNDMIQVIEGKIGNYPVKGYLLIDWKRSVSAIFDTGYSPDHILQFLKDKAVRLAAICITHAHPDHIGGLEVVQSETGAPIYLHLSEGVLQTKRLNQVVSIKEGMMIQVGSFQVSARETPGHTDGGMTYTIQAQPGIAKPVAFVGDALFAGSLGRAKSSHTYSVLLRSVRDQILSLPLETLLFPGHGPVTTVAEEKKHNPFFRNI